MTEYARTMTVFRIEDDPRETAVIPILEGILKRPPTLPYKDEMLVDLASREQFGIEKYGVPLRVGDGSDAIRELYQELIDAAVYATQAVLELQLRVTGDLRDVEMTDEEKSASLERLPALESTLFNLTTLLSSIRSVLANRDDPSRPAVYEFSEILSQVVEGILIMPEVDSEV